MHISWIIGCLLVKWYWSTADLEHTEQPFYKHCYFLSGSNENKARCGKGSRPWWEITVSASGRCDMSVHLIITISKMSVICTQMCSQIKQAKVLDHSSPADRTDVTFIHPDWTFVRFLTKTFHWRLNAEFIVSTLAERNDYWLEFLLLVGKSLRPTNIWSLLASSGSGEGQILPSEAHNAQPRSTYHQAPIVHTVPIVQNQEG